MANTTTSPNMGMPVPVPSVDPGPDWANNIVADMSIIDSHDHSPGKGAPITGPIVGSAISGATINSSSIGATTPSTGAFTSVAAGPGPAFKMQRFTGTVPSTSFVAIMAAGSYTNLLGVMGTTSEAGGAHNNFALGTGFFSFTTPGWCYLFVTNAGEIRINNFDTGASNSFDVTVFYT